MYAHVKGHSLEMYRHLKSECYDVPDEVRREAKARLTGNNIVHRLFVRKQLISNEQAVNDFVNSLAIEDFSDFVVQLENILDAETDGQDLPSSASSETPGEQADPQGEAHDSAGRLHAFLSFAGGLTSTPLGTCRTTTTRPCR